MPPSHPQHPLRHISPTGPATTRFVALPHARSATAVHPRPAGLSAFGIGQPRRTRPSTSRCDQVRPTALYTSVRTRIATDRPARATGARGRRVHARRRRCGAATPPPTVTARTPRTSQSPVPTKPAGCGPAASRADTLATSKRLLGFRFL